MSDFKAKMHQNRFPLGICPRPRWGSLRRSSRPLAGFKGPYFEGKADIGRKGKGRGRGRQGRRSRGGEGKGGKEGEGTPCVSLNFP